MSLSKFDVANAIRSLQDIEKMSTDEAKVSTITQMIMRCPDEDMRVLKSAARGIRSSGELISTAFMIHSKIDSLTDPFNLKPYQHWVSPHFSAEKMGVFKGLICYLVDLNAKNNADAFANTPSHFVEELYENLKGLLAGSNCLQHLEEGIFKDMVCEAPVGMGLR